MSSPACPLGCSPNTSSRESDPPSAFLRKQLRAVSARSGSRGPTEPVAVVSGQVDDGRGAGQLEPAYPAYRVQREHPPSMLKLCTVHVPQRFRWPRRSRIRFRHRRGPAFVCPPIMDRSASAHAAAWVVMHLRVHSLPIDRAHSVDDAISWLADSPAGSSAATRRGMRVFLLAVPLPSVGSGHQGTRLEAKSLLPSCHAARVRVGAERISHLRIQALDAGSPSVYDENCRAIEVPRRRRR